MTTKDKTGDQLMASIRKTKTETAAPAKQAAKAPAATPKAAPKATPKAAAKTRARRKRAQSTATKRSAPVVKRPAGDTYQSGRRIWPD